MCQIYEIKENELTERKTVQKFFGSLSENNTSLELNQIS